MKFSYQQIKEIIPTLKWGPEKLASKLSIIGHEAEVLTDDSIDVKLTTNRKDCQDINYLAYDLVALFSELGANNDMIKYKKGKKIDVTISQINKILGSNVSPEEYKNIERLGFEVNSTNVVVPDFRLDVSEGADIAEEVFRMVGSDALNIKPLDKLGNVESKEFEFLNNLRATLSEIGASETRNISFTRTGKTKLDNPFSTSQPYMRETLLFGLLQTISKNPYLRRNFFYEIGNVFKPNESTRIGLIITGNKKPEDLITNVEKAIGVNLAFKAVSSNDLDSFSINQPNVMFCELETNNIKLLGKVKYKSSGMPTYKKISKYPPYSVDISITTVTSEEDNFITKVKENFDNLLITELIDTYSGGDKSKTTRTYKLIFQNLEESFTKDQTSEIYKKINTYI